MMLTRSSPYSSCLWGASLLLASLTTGCELLVEVRPPPSAIADLALPDMRALADLDQPPDLSADLEDMDLDLSRDQGADQAHDQAHDQTATLDMDPPLPWRTLLRLNSGASSPLELDGQLWAADRDWTGSRRVALRQPVEIEGTTLDPIFWTESFRSDGYRLPVEDGRYMVRLHFAETWGGINGPGQRVFSVSVEGQRIDTLDAFGQTGGINRALMREVLVEVRDQWLDVRLEAEQLNTMISGIELLTQRGALRERAAFIEHERERPRACGKTYTISPSMTPEAIQATLALVEPGDELVLADGLYSNLRLTLPSSHVASPACPTVIRAQTPLGARLTGADTLLNMQGAHVALSGLTFINTVRPNNQGPAVRLGAGPGARLTHSLFQDTACPAPPADGYVVHVSSNSRDARVDHNTFQTLCGGAIFVFTSASTGAARRARLDHNRFDEPLTDLPLVVLGAAGAAQLTLDATLEFNAFDRALAQDSPQVLIQSKGARLRHNVFQRSRAPGVALARSEDVWLIGNVFIDSGGLEIAGRGHVVLSNMFVRSAAVSALAGQGPTSASVERPYAQDLTLAHNTFWASRDVAISLGAQIGTLERTQPARDITLINNAFISDSRAPEVLLVELVRDSRGASGVEASTVRASCNAAQLDDPARHRVGWPPLAPELAPLGVTLADDGLPRLSEDSPLIDSACPLELTLPSSWPDFRGHPRPNLAAQRDRGADERSADASLAPARAPDVGAFGDDAP